ncbi:Ig-like domain-containing protein [Mycolicibacterium sp. Dal123E01]|uniref:Ig-like domain-containing protein n=1 Tax=Mycolicibacterium sp. Dal123E01 TaxID=3457578 RepID=UPI00403E6CE2
MTALKTTSNKTTSAAAVTDPITALLNAIQDSFAGASLLFRRALFNEAPTVKPVQINVDPNGPITGKIGAVDPEGDHLVYKVTQQGQFGNVTINPDGTYTYTPNSDFTGIDAFTVSATDTGPHINLLNWFRGASTSAAGAVYEDPSAPKITYTFIYGDGSQFWNSAARADLQASAIILSSYFKPDNDVNLTYKVTGQYSVMGSTLASSGSDLISNDGFAMTVVQNKIVNGVDSNGAAADGTITWNFGYGWGYGNTVPSGSYDFQSTAMHEMLHTFGFLSVVDSAGNNTVENWTDFDKFVVNKNGTSVFTGSNGTTFNTAYNSNLTGGDTGLYFGGPGSYAWIANGNKPVPLYTPNPWESGSSMSHLDDDFYTGSMEKLMNATSDTGLGVRELSPIEIAIMKDLGYTMVSQSTGAAVLFLGMMLYRRRKAAVEHRVAR